MENMDFGCNSFILFINLFVLLHIQKEKKGNKGYQADK